MAKPIQMTSKQKMILILLLGAQFMLSVDFSILNVALPDIGKNLGFSLANLQWVATTFSLMAAGLTLLSGRIADLFGRRKLFVGGMLLLGFGSLMGGLSTSPTMLLVARILQGLATAVVTPAAFGLLTTSFKEGPLRTKALSLNGALLSAGFTVGSILGGVLTSALNWRWAFFINVPVALFISIMTPRYLGESRGERVKHLDAAGATTVTTGLLTLVYGVTAFGETGLDHPLTVISLIVAPLAFIMFAIVESRSRQPLLSLRVLQLPTVKWGNIAGFTIFAMETAMVFLTTLYLQKVLGLQPAAAGLAFGLLGVSAFVAGVIAPKYIQQFGSKRTLFIGLMGQGITTLLLVIVGQQRAWLWFILAVSVFNGFLHMTALVSYMVTATSGLSNKDEGVVSSLTSMTQLTSISLGIPLMSAVFTERMNAASTLPTKAAFLHGFHYAIVVDGVITMAVAGLVAARLRNHEPAVSTMAVPATE